MEKCYENGKYYNLQFKLLRLKAFFFPQWQKNAVKDLTPNVTVIITGPDHIIAAFRPHS